MNIKKLWLATISILLTATGCTHTPRQARGAAGQKKKSKGRTLPTAFPKPIGSTKVLHNGAEELATAQEKNKEQHTITVWIHGTRFVHDYVFKDFFYRKKGLHHSSEYKKTHQLKKSSCAMIQEDTPRFTDKNFYFFGWSGHLSHKKRKIAAQNLHNALTKLIKTYKKTNGVVPKLRLITHSHGGNVALYFSKINDLSANPITIHELILLACPVQQKTAKQIPSKTFERIYSLYSGLDMIQVLDPQGLHQLSKDIKRKQIKPLFSQRLFAPQENLTQVRLKINGRGILHIEFLATDFAKLLPHILQELDVWNKDNPDAHTQNRQLTIRAKRNNAKFIRKILKHKAKKEHC